MARRFSSIDFSLEHRSRKYTCTYVGTEYQKLLRENENADHVRKTIVYRSTVIYFADVFAFYSCRCGSRTSSSSGREKRGRRQEEEEEEEETGDRRQEKIFFSSGRRR